MKRMMQLLCVIIIFLIANITTLNILHSKIIWGIVLTIFFIALNVSPSFVNRNLPIRRLRICADGCELLILFLFSTGASALYLLGILSSHLDNDIKGWIINLLMVILIESVVFWNGIIRVYCTSFQIGLKWRIIGITCGWIPIIHLFTLGKIISIASRESKFESEKVIINSKRENDKLCSTKYPILLVHGVFFRDYKYFNYWGRIPKELERNGAILYYGNHQSASSVADSAEELAVRIKQVIEESGYEKVNIIAHSKGGLDCRYAISALGMNSRVASLTTINTPHRGCIFADYLLDKIPQSVKDKVALGYNVTLKKIGDEQPDFISAVNDLTASACVYLNEKLKDLPDVYYQSVGSKLNHASEGRFPLNFSTRLVKYFDGPNDGLVAESSFEWGECYTFITTEGNRGVSHGDMIDLNRENIRDFDVREFYVNLVHDLKKKGY